MLSTHGTAWMLFCFSALYVVGVGVRARMRRVESAMFTLPAM
jgi:hypothetical protein